MEASFEYTAPSAQTRAMDEQLRSLGGSDLARVGSAGVWVRVAPPPQPEHGQEEPETVVGVDETVVVVRDPREPIDAPTSQSYRRYRVSGTFAAEASQAEVHDAVGAPEVDWLVDGFNSTFVAFGEVGMGKTYSLFGGAGGERSWQDGGLCGNMITQLFQRVEAAEPGSYVVGISCWEIVNSDTFDLLAFPVAGTNSTNPRFINVRVNSRAAALKVLERARVGSHSWEKSNVNTDSEPFVALPNAGHSFVRLTLIDVSKRRCSTLHLVDLAGSQSLDRRMAPRAFQVTAENAKARKNINQQLLAFSRVVQEMAAANEGAGATEASQAQLISARDSRLTQVLGPIMGQNCRTIFLATVSAELDHYSDTIATLRTATRAMDIACPCVPTTLLPPAEESAQAAAGGNLPLDELLCQSAAMVPLQQVLSVRMINEISHLDSSVQSIQSSAPSAVTARSGPSSVSASSDGGSSTTGGGPTSIKSQMENLREYMAQNYPGAPLGAEAAGAAPTAAQRSTADADEDDVTQGQEDQGQTNSPAAKKRRTPARENATRQFETGAQESQASSRQFQREFEQISREMEQAEAEAKKMGMMGGSTGIREQFRSNYGDLSDSLHRTAPPPAEPEPTESAQQFSSAEDNTLRMNYESLLSVLREVEMEKGRLEGRVEELQHEQAELEMQHELAFDTKRVEVIELQSKLRKAAGRGGFGEVFDMFEHQMELLQKEVEQLREANVALERQMVLGKDGGFPGGDGDGDADAAAARYSARAGAHEKRAEMMSRKVQQELQMLRKENMELKKKERLFARHQKGFEDASKKIGKLSKEIGAREAQLRSEAMVTEEYERRIFEMEALVNDAKEREEKIHAGYHATFKENEELKQRMRKMRGDLGAQTHTRARSTYGKVASAAGLNVFEHCKRLERDLPSSSRCLSNFQRVLKAIDKQDQELVSALDREQEMLELIREYEGKSRETFRELCTVHQRVFARPPSQRVLADLAAAMDGGAGARAAPHMEGRA